MRKIHPLSQAEADRVFPKAERAAAAERMAAQLHNIRRRYQRANDKAAEALLAWMSPLGTAEDVLDYERAAELQQKIALELAVAEEHMRRLMP